MRILFIGDIFGRPGRDALTQWLPEFRKAEAIDLVIANVENSAQGKGITRGTHQETIAAGVDVMTGGNHSFAQKEGTAIHDQDSRLLRPANLPQGTPGRGFGIYEEGLSRKVAVINLMGRAFMKPIDCPFRAARALVNEALTETPIIIVDFHAEATSEKVAMAAWLDGTATAVLGTHTHIPSADARISSKGTAAMTDVGMTGPYDSVIGVKKEIVLDQLIVGMPVRHEVAESEVRICGVLIDVADATGRARSIRAIREPEFYTG